MILDRHEYLVRHLIGNMSKAAREQMRYRQVASNIRESLFAKQLEVIESTETYNSILGTRRAAKTYTNAAHAVIKSLEVPGHRTLIILPRLTDALSNYWGTTEGSGGIPWMFAHHGVTAHLKNSAPVSWKLPNGSSGTLVGVDTMEAVEAIRGTLAKAHLIIIDEAQSIGHAKLHTLLDSILPVGLSDAKGRLYLSGTPGRIFFGKFWEASDPRARNPQGKPYSYAEAWGGNWDDRPMWRRFKMSMLDNPHARHVFADMERKRRLEGLPESDPTYQRETLGNWTNERESLVYALARAEREKAYTSWKLETAERPKDWGIGIGIDYGTTTAITVVAYSQADAKVAQIDEIVGENWTVDDIEANIDMMIHKWGTPSHIVADNAGKQITDTINTRRGWNVLPCKKTNKNQYIWLLNAALMSGRAQVCPNSQLEGEMLNLAWKDMAPGTPMEKWQEDTNSSNTNHLADSYLYIYREVSQYFTHGSFAAETTPLRERAPYREIIEAEIAEANDGYPRGLADYLLGLTKP